MSDVLSFPKGSFRKIDSEEEKRKEIEEIINETLNPDQKGYLILGFEEDSGIPEAMWGGELDLHQVISSLEIIKTFLIDKIVQDSMSE